LRAPGGGGAPARAAAGASDLKSRGVPHVSPLALLVSRRAGIAVLAAAALAGCTVGPRYQRPPLDVPAATRTDAGPAGRAAPAWLADQAWWAVFRDDALRGLIAQALQNGYDVRLAAARVEEARANAGIAGAERFPALQLSGQWQRGRQSEFSSSPGA